MKKHRESEHHREACEAVILSKTKSIDEHLDIGHASKKPGNRKILLTILENIQFLAKQGLPLRNWADNESKEVKSNFMQLFLLRSIDNPKISEWLSRKNGTYVSKDIQNEIIKLMAHRVLCDIASDLQKANFYVLMADEATDVSNKEQLVFVFRWVDDNFNAHEEFVGMYQLDKTDAETIYMVIKDVLLTLNLDVHKMRGQCYDGATQPKNITIDTSLYGTSLLTQECHKYRYSTEMLFTPVPVLLELLEPLLKQNSGILYIQH